MFLKGTAPVDGDGFGINGHLSENVSQVRNGAERNVGVVPSADGVSGQKQIFSDGTLAQKDRSLVIKEVGISSAVFIGPLCRPQEPVPKAKRKPKAKPKRKADLENELSEFYRELEDLEPVDCVDGSCDDDLAGENNPEAWEPQNPPPTGEQMFPKDQDSRRPHPDRHDHGDHGDHWQPKRHRPDFQPEQHWHRPDQLFSPNQWQHSPAFRPPPWPPFHSYPLSGYGRPPGPPPPPHLPPGPLYPPVFRPQMRPNYTCPEAEHRRGWEGPQFAPGPRYPPFGDFGDYGYDGPQDCGAPVHPPEGSDGSRGDGGNGCSLYEEVTGPQPCMDAYQKPHLKPEPHPDLDPDPEQEPNPWLQCRQPPHSDCDYRPAPFLLLILMRGLPGSGKSTLAKKLLCSGPNGLVLSTDDYFAECNRYAYSPSLIGDAHDWNQKRAREAMDDGRSPVIIDNTNLQAWEMKPYVEMALERGYNVDFHEPHTSWKLDPFELEKRNKHGVPSKKIAQMRDRFELPISVDIVLNSRDPPHKNAPRPPSQCPPR